MISITNFGADRDLLICVIGIAPTSALRGRFAKERPWTDGSARYRCASIAFRTWLV